MTSYLIYPTEQEALDRSKAAHTTDTVSKMRMSERAARNVIAEMVTKYRWATDIGLDGQTALVIDGDIDLLTDTEKTKLVTKLPDGEGENWYKPPPDMGAP